MLFEATQHHRSAIWAAVTRGRCEFLACPIAGIESAELDVSINSYDMFLNMAGYRLERHTRIRKIKLIEAPLRHNIFN